MPSTLPAIPPSLASVRHVISIKDFNREQMVDLLHLASAMENYRGKDLEGLLMATLFFEPSTRTRLSFESAMLQLGGRTLGFADKEVSSTKKGETLRDSIIMTSRYADVIVIRHSLEGAARVAAEASVVPVLNGGDGANQHPTQTFLDLYTIWKSHPWLLEDKALTVGLLGDLRYGRTVHSLVVALSFFNVRFRFICPPSLRMPEEYIELLNRRNIPWEESKLLEDHVNELDILYATRIQEERFPDPVEYGRVRNAYNIKAEHLENVKEGFRLLHPLPRLQEIDASVDKLPLAGYFDQAANGVPMRKALIYMLLGNSPRRLGL